MLNTLWYYVDISWGSPMLCVCDPNQIYLLCEISGDKPACHVDTGNKTRCIKGMMVAYASLVLLLSHESQLANHTTYM